MTAVWDDDPPARPGVIPGPTGEPAPAYVDLRSDADLLFALASDCLLTAAQELKVPVNSKRRVPTNGASYTISESCARATALAAVAAAATELGRASVLGRVVR